LAIVMCSAVRMSVFDMRCIVQLSEDPHPEVRVCVAYGIEAMADAYSRNTSELARRYYGDLVEFMWGLVLAGSDGELC
jgi:hypothetical protein